MSLTPPQFKLAFGAGALLLGLLGGGLRWRKLRKRKHPVALEILTELIQPDILAALLLILVGATAIYFSIREMGS